MEIKKGDRVTCKEEIKRSGGKHGSYAVKGDTLQVCNLNYMPVLLVENTQTGVVFSMRMERFKQMQGLPI